MMKNPVPHLCGVRYNLETANCYIAGCRYYKDQFQIELQEYAVPEDFWKHGINIFMDNFREEGFSLVDLPMHELLPGDVFLINAGTKIPTHCAVYTGGNHIFHHARNQISCWEPYTGIWRRYTCATLRHPQAAVQFGKNMPNTTIRDLLPRHQREKLDAILAAAGHPTASESDEGTVRSDPQVG